MASLFLENIKVIHTQQAIHRCKSCFCQANEVSCQRHWMKHLLDIIAAPEPGISAVFVGPSGYPRREPARMGA